MGDQMTGALTKSAEQLLLGHIREIEKVNADIKKMTESRSEIFKSAKDSGFDIPALKAVLKQRSMDPSDLEELEMLIALYAKAIDDASS